MLTAQTPMLTAHTPMLTAQTPMMTAQSPMLTPMPLMNYSQRFTGQVKSYSPENGYGFIEGDELMNAIGNNVYLNRREVVQATGIEFLQLPRGCLLSFVVHYGPTGQPQARELKFEDPEFVEKIQTMHRDSLPNPDGSFTPKVATVSLNPEAMQVVQSNQRIRGYINKFVNTNYVFIKGSEVNTLFGADVFVGQSQLRAAMGPYLKTIDKRTFLTFNVVLSKQGKLQAENVILEEDFKGGIAAPDMSGFSVQKGSRTEVAPFSNPNFVPHMPSNFPHMSKTKMSEAEAIASVQADIDRFRHSFGYSEERGAAAAEGGAAGGDVGMPGGAEEMDLKRPRGSRDMAQSRSPFRRREDATPSEITAAFQFEISQLNTALAEGPPPEKPRDIIDEINEQLSKPTNGSKRKKDAEDKENEEEKERERKKKREKSEKEEKKESKNEGEKQEPVPELDPDDSSAYALLEEDFARKTGHDSNQTSYYTAPKEVKEEIVEGTVEVELVANKKRKTVRLFPNTTVREAIEQFGRQLCGEGCVVIHNQQPMHNDARIYEFLGEQPWRLYLEDSSR